jgi:hypothetical protein
LFWNILYASFSSEHKIIKIKFHIHTQKNMFTCFQIIWYGSLDKRPKLGKMGMIFGMWNIRNLYRAGLLKRVVKEM